MVDIVVGLSAVIEYQPVVAFATVYDIATRIPLVNHVVAGASVHRVVAAAGVNHVVAIGARYKVVAIGAVYQIACHGHLQDVGGN